MKYFIVTIFILILIYYMFTKTKESFTILSNNNIVIKKHDQYGRNVYANKDYKINDIIEICPTIYDENNKINNGIINNYLFKGSKNKSILAFGYCSLYNHRDDNNASWKISDDNSIITFFATKNIKKGEEIMVNYGDGYWKSRKNIIKI